ncbi:Os01g0145200, partial [Oryza sativa Japonica Group]
VVRRPDASALILEACITCQRAAKEMHHSCVIHNFARRDLSI